MHRQGSPDPLASGPAKARDLIYEWDQTPEVVNGADWPSPVPLWYPVRPIVGWFLLSRPVSFHCLPFLSLSPFFSSHNFLSGYRATSRLIPPLQFLPFLSFLLVLVAEDALALRCLCSTRNLPLVNYASTIVPGLLRANWASVVVVVISSSRLSTLNLEEVMICFWE